jgi:hypothetical protein
MAHVEVAIVVFVTWVESKPNKHRRNRNLEPLLCKQTTSDRGLFDRTERGMYLGRHWGQAEALGHFENKSVLAGPQGIATCC